jgi:hypothetical protein
VGSLLRSAVCHYCPQPATTEDHVVPRSLYRHTFAWHPAWFRDQAVVPACAPCNEAKSSFHVRCCVRCEWVWQYAQERGWMVAGTVETVDLGERRKELRRKQQRNALVWKGMTPDQVERQRQIKRSRKKLGQQAKREGWQFGDSRG